MADDDAPARGFESNVAARQPDELRRLAQLEAVFDALPVLISYVGRDQRYQFNNHAYEEWFGHSHADIVGRHLSEVLGAEAYAVVRPHVEAALAGNRVSYEADLPYKDGGPRHVLVEYVPDRQNGAVAGFFALVQDITARRSAESALSRSEERLRRVLETEAVGVIFFNHDGVVVDANDAFLKMTGYSREQVTRGELDWRRMTPDEWVAASEAQMEKLASTGRIGPYEKEYILADGTRRWMHFAGRDLGDGTIAEYCFDITDRTDAQDALHQSERRFRVLFEKAGVGMAEIDSEWRIVSANEAYCHIAGRSQDELMGLSCLAFTHADDVRKSEEMLRSVSGPGPDAVSFEKRYAHADGSIVWIRSNLARIEQPDGSNRFLKIVEDITEAKNAEFALKEVQDALKEKSLHLETLNRVGSSLAGELDLERVVQMVTDAGVELTGAQFGAFFYNVTGPSGESFMLFTLSGAERSQFERFGMPRNTKVFAPTFGGGIVRSDDITKDPRYGQNPPHKGMPEGHLPVISYLAVPVASRTGEVIGGLFFGHPEPGRFKERHERLMEGIAAQAAIAIDNARLFREAQREIEQRVKAEQALTALNETLESRVAEEIDRRSHAEEALRQAQKMETVGQLSGGIAHDFNNLLQIIHGNLTIMQRSVGSEDAKLQRTIANALSGTERAAALTQRLLAFSRRQPLDPKPVDVNRMIGDMTELLRRTLGEQIQVETRLDPALPNAHVDANQLENAILNLAINSRDAMPEGGTLAIETRLAEVDRAYAELHPDAEPGSYVRITVSDTGVGMSPEIAQRAVEPFFTTKEVGQGTGLGLSMVYGFLKQSGGHLNLRSEENKGTAVDIFLPCSAAAAEDPEPSGGDGGLPLGRGERILVCEDDADVRRFSTETLAELGYRVEEAGDADSALDLLDRGGPVDLLFTDIVLPGGKTGADLARAARERQPGLKVLFTTGYARTALDNTELSPALELISKPFSVEDLARRLRQLLDQR